MKTVLNRFVVLAALSAVTLPLCAALEWNVPAPCVTRDGDTLTVTVGKNVKNAWNTMARATVDLAPFAGKAVDVSIRCRGEDVSAPRETWLGLKVMLHLKNADGSDAYPQAGRKTGTFGWTTLSFHCDIADPAPKEASLALGLQSATGTAVFDLSSLKIEESAPLFVMTNRDYRIKYPDEIRAKKPRRGVMLPERAPTEDDFKTLHAWGATLARFQIVRGWGETDGNQDLDEYDRWLDGRLDDLEKTLPLAEKYGIELVVDLHVPPGGRDAGNDMNMFYDARFADRFVACWKRIATRFAGRKGIFGFDLINEPTQTRRALPDCDYWNLQRRAAEAVRAIDPKTPIIIESNDWDSSSGFRYLSPLAMDNVIYQAHLYDPHQFTHQGVGGRWNRTKWPDAEKGWNREFLRKTLEPVLEFRRRHDARIYIGEFSAITWGEGAGDYIADCIALFEEYGFDWTYHAFREWNGWSVEHQVADPVDARRLVPSEDNPRKRALLSGLRR